MRVPSSLRANRFLSFVATTCSSSSRVNELPCFADADKSASIPAHPASSSVMPMRCGSCRSTRLRNLLTDVARLESTLTFTLPATGWTTAASGAFDDQRLQHRPLHLWHVQ